jgi:hypothetical protein
MPYRCANCIYLNNNTLLPKCIVLKGRCNPNSQYCDFTKDD